MSDTKQCPRRKKKTKANSVKEERNVKSVLNTNESIEKHTEGNKEQYENHKEEKFRAYPLDVTIVIKDSGIWAPNSWNDPY